MDKSLEKQLQNDFLEAYREAVNGYKFRSPSFLSMVDRNGAYETACRLCNTLNWQSGFQKLAILGRCDLTVEFIILQDKYINHFSELQIYNAKEKVKAAKQIKGHSY